MDEKSGSDRENVTAYGEFVASFNGWTAPGRIKQKSKELEEKIEKKEEKR